MYQSCGITLLEVMISLCLLSITLLGFDAIQIEALRQTKGNYYASIAWQQIKIIRQRLTIRHADNMEAVINQWNEQNQVVLPQGRGDVSGDYPQYEITIYWGERHESGCEHNRIGKSGCIRTIM